MTRNISFASEEIYHLYNRGTEKRKIFLNKKDYDRFLALLFICNSDKVLHLSDWQGSTLPKIFEIEKGLPIVKICAYCLMPNHFHLLLKETNAGNISKFMQKLITAYTMYFNKKYERSGALFQGKFKAQHADTDNYLKYLLAYIHLNPLKIKDPEIKAIKNKEESKTFLHDYSYSSFLDYIDINRPEQTILEMDALPKYFETSLEFEESIFDWIKIPKE